MGNPSAALTASGKPLVTGGVLYAPTGTALPTDAVTALNGSFVGAGYATDSGLTGSEKRGTTDVKDWGGIVVATLQTEFKATFKFGFLEILNDLTAKAIYGDSNVTVTAANGSHGRQIATAVNGAESPHLSWVFAMYSGTKKIRIVVPDGQITELDDIDYKSDNLIGRNVTLTAYPDSSGNTHYVYSDDGSVASVPSIASVLPSGAAAAELVTITGAYFTGTTAVTFGGTGAADFEIVSDSKIVASLPAGSAGSAAVIVTNATGASSSFAYTRA